MTAQETELKGALTEAGVFAILFTTEKACHAATFDALLWAAGYLREAAEAIERYRLIGVPELAAAAGHARACAEAIAREAERRQQEGETLEGADQHFQVMGQLCDDRPADEELLLRLAALREGRLDDARATRNVRARLRLV